MASGLPVLFPCKWKLLKQPQSSFYHNNSQIIHLHAWKLLSKCFLVQGISEKIAIRRAKEWSNLIANFAGDQSVDRVKAPEWDLAFVLGTLLEEPFESFDKAL